MHSEAIVAIDHGTSGIKSSLVTPTGEVLATEREDTPTEFDATGRVEQDPASWTAALTRTCRRLIERGIAQPDQVRAVCVSSTFSSTVAVDRAGKPLLPCITWMDTRGGPHVERLMRGFPSFQGYGVAKALKWIRITAGAPTLSGKDDLAHALLVKHAHPDIYERTYKFLPSKDYINLWLTGECAASFDSMTLFWLSDTRNIDRIHYHDGLVRAAGLDREKLPDMRPSHAPLGTLRAEVADALGLPQSTTVYTGSPDHQAAGIGSGAVDDFDAHLYIGTSSWIQGTVPFKKTDLLHSIASLPTAIPGRYYCANEQDLAGGCLPFLLNNVLFHDNALLRGKPPDASYELLDQIAGGVPPGSHKLIFTPWLNGERTPVDDETVRGALFNVSTTTTQDHIIRAIMEGVAYNTRWSLKYVERFFGRDLSRLRIIGGGALSDVWCQIFADVLGKQIDRVREPREANARGAALIASVGMGRIDWSDISGLVAVEASFHPNVSNRATYDEMYDAFVSFYRRNRTLYRDLNKRKGHA